MSHRHALRAVLAALLAFGSTVPALAQLREKSAPVPAAPASVSAPARTSAPSLQAPAPIDSVPALPTSMVSAPGTVSAPASASAGAPAQAASYQHATKHVDNSAAAPAAAPLSKEAAPAASAGLAAPAAEGVIRAGADGAAQRQTLSGRVAARLERLRQAFLGLGSASGSAPSVDAAAPAPSARRSSGLMRSVRAAVLGAAVGVGSIVGAPHPALAQTPAASAQLAQESRVQRVSSADDIVRKWDPSTHVMVIGQLPGSVDESVLRDLAAKLKGSHWTVVLVGDSQGLSYVDDNGSRQYGNQAVEFALGHGVAHKPAYTSLSDARTGQSDGVLMFISYSPRYMWYRPSDAQNAVGLTRDAFSSDFIRIPRGVMQHGGDVVKAVTETKSYVEEAVSNNVEKQFADAKGALADAKAAVSELSLARGRMAKGHAGAGLSLVSVESLNAALAKAQQQYDAKDLAGAAASAQAVAQRARASVDAVSGYEKAYAGAQDALARADAAVATLTQASARFHSAHPKAGGDLARPGLDGMSASLAAARRSLEADPAGAAKAAADVDQKAQDVLGALARYDGAAQTLKDLQAAYDAQSARSRASAAYDQLASARQSLEDARALYSQGESGYAAKLSAAKTSVDAARSAIDSADRSAAAARFAMFLFSLFGALGAALTGFLLNRRVRPIRAQALEEYAAKKALVEGKTDAALSEVDKQVETYVGPEQGPGSKGYIGRTAEVAARIRKDTAAMSIIWPSLDKVMEQSEALVHPKGIRALAALFWPTTYQKALKRMKDEPVTFAPEDGLPELYGKKKDWRTDLYGSLADQKPFTKSFEELNGDYDAHAKAAVAGLDLIQAKLFALEPTLQAVEGAANAAQALKPQLDAAGAADGFFLLPSLFSVLLPAAAAALEALKKRHGQDPIGAMESAGTEAGRMSSEGKALAEWAAAARKGALARLAASEAALSASGTKTETLVARTAELSAQADALAARGAKGSIAQALQQLSADVDALAAKAETAVAAAKALAQLRASIAAGQTAVAQAREELGRALSLPAERTLVEAGEDPSEFLANAGRAADAAQAALDRGAVDEAVKAVTAGSQTVASADAIVADSKAAVAAQAQASGERAAEAARLKASVPEHEALLKQIRQKYAASVLSLRSGDAAHPSANGTVDDNVDEANEAVASADAKMAASAKAYRDGRVLEAAHLLAQAKAHHEIAQHRLSEIAEKKARLERTVTSNQALLEALQSTAKTQDRDVAADLRSMKPTTDALAAAEKALKAAKDAVEQVKGDPFEAESQLQAVKAALEKVAVMFRNDADLYAHAGSTLQAADQALSRANAVSREANGDGIADSSRITQAYGQLEQLGRAYAKAKGAYAVPHGDWHAVDVEAGRIASDAAHVQADLRSELAAAQAASAAIDNAASKVREAASWTGSYGVSVPGSPGSGELSRARSALDSGDYGSAQSYAESARRAAASAIAAAEAEVQRLYEAEQRRIAEERRRREEEEAARQRAAEEARRRSEDSSSSWGSSSSGGGGGGFGGSDSGGGGGSW